MRILLVEDDKILCDTIGMQLRQNGYQADLCYRGDDSLFYASEYPYDVIILDRMLPGMNGISLLQTLRQKGITVPVIITTALDGLHDRIDGLDAGADDYLVKPFAAEELLARIRAIMRRQGRTSENSRLIFSNLCLDTVSHELSLAEDKISVITLSGRESALLEYLMRNAGQTLPRSLILSYVWGPGSEVEDGNLDNYIYFLRRRLKALHGKANIKTCHGVGYRLEESHD